MLDGSCMQLKHAENRGPGLAAVVEDETKWLPHRACKYERSGLLSQSASAEMKMGAIQLCEGCA